MSGTPPAGKPKVNYGRIPEVLAEEIEEAFIPLSHLGPWETMRLLKRYRKNRNEAIAKRGIHGTDFKDIAAGFSSARDLVNIQRLDEVYQKLHAFRAEGGARRYLSNSVASLFGNQGGRPQIHDDEAIKAVIADVLAAHKGPKRLKGTDIIARVQEHFVKCKKPVPGKTKISQLIAAVRTEPG